MANRLEARCRPPDDKKEQSAMRSMMRLASLLGSVSMILLPELSHAREACPGTAVEITIAAASQRENLLVCTGARQALDLLALCGIAPRTTIDIRIKHEVRHPLAGLIFGYYDLSERHIVLTSLDGLPELMQDTSYAGLPPNDFYQSLAVHEVVHSVMHQNLEAKPLSHTAYEYPAYALQIASLPAPVRSAFMKAFDQERLERPAAISDTVLAFAPYLFAARAYNHFTTSPSGCTSIRAAMTKGDANF
jgi:hypothetical protein